MTFFYIKHDLQLNTCFDKSSSSLSLSLKCIYDTSHYLNHSVSSSFGRADLYPIKFEEQMNWMS